ncbi:MAG: hypothetical protein UY93_C0007G0002 [Parcubacteria group bacterium GW2011_GWA1_56_13]|nr:MAG: hypothetical protein UY93_C0007G0002 [Parcubacteria group bacterium GW2011_GWA1_56_13]
MDPAGQGSFIPKASLTAASRGGGIGIFFLLALLIFVMSLISAGAAFGYQRILGSTITNKDADLRRAEGAFDAGTIQDLRRMDNRLTQARGLLQKHVAPSAILYFLSTITLERVQLNSFDMILDKDGGASLTITGTADSFSSVALQSDQFGSTKVLKDVIVSGVSVNETGKVSFAVNAKVDPSLVLYGNSLNQAPVGQTPAQ